MISTNPLDYEDFLGAETNKIESIGRILLKRFNALLSNNDLIPLCTDNISCAAFTSVGDLE